MLPRRWVKAVRLQQVGNSSPHFQKRCEYSPISLIAVRRCISTLPQLDGSVTAITLLKGSETKGCETRKEKDILSQPPVTLTHRDNRYRSETLVGSEIDTLCVSVARLPKPLAGDCYDRRLRKGPPRQKYLPSLLLSEHKSQDFPG